MKKNFLTSPFRLKIKIETIILSVIILLAFFLRTVNLENNPKGMYGDGLTLVYDSYSILKTGHDQKGNFLPFVFELGGSRPPVYVYATVPFTALFGPTDLAARSVSILSGIGLVILMFEFGRMIYSAKLGLIAATITAISPWDLALSRGPFETHLALFLGFLGVIAFFKAEQKKSWYLVSGLSFALSMQTYPTYRLTVPLFLLALSFIFRQRILAEFKVRRFLLTISILTIVVSFALSLGVTFLSGNSDRFSKINFFTQTDVKSAMSQSVTLGTQFDSLPHPFDKFFHNSELEYLITLITNYINNFTLAFLFLHGDAQPLSNPAEMGEFYWVDGIFIVFGVFFFYQSKKKKKKKQNFSTNKKLLPTLIIWSIITPIATSLVGKPHALRDSFMLIPILLLSSLGLLSILANKKMPYRPLLIVTLTLLFLVEFAFFVDRFYFVAPNKFANFWSYPAKQASEIALQNKSKYKFVILSARIDNMEFAYPVYAKLEPSQVIYQNLHQAQEAGLGEYKFLTYDNVYIGSIPNTRLREFLASLPGSVLYIGSIEDKNFVDGYTIDINADNLPDLIIHNSTAGDLKI